jgi:hypothetical protein
MKRTYEEFNADFRRRWEAAWIVDRGGRLTVRPAERAAVERATRREYCNPNFYTPEQLADFRHLREQVLGL